MAPDTDDCQTKLTPVRTVHTLSKSSGEGKIRIAIYMYGIIISIYT